MITYTDLNKAVTAAHEIANEERHGQRRSCYLVQRGTQIKLVWYREPVGKYKHRIMMKVEPSKKNQNKTGQNR